MNIVPAVPSQPYSPVSSATSTLPRPQPRVPPRSLQHRVGQTVDGHRVDGPRVSSRMPFNSPRFSSIWLKRR